MAKKVTTKKVTTKSESPFEVIDAAQTAWDGSPTTLNPNDNVNLAQPPTGSMVLAYQNNSLQNNPGDLSLTSGGSQPVSLKVPALANQPSMYIRVWGGNNLSVTNTSPPQMAIPIWIEGVGPGMPKLVPVALPMDGTVVPLTTYKAAQGNLSPRWMQVTLQANSGDNTIFALIGGPTDPSGNNAYVISLNDPNGTTGYGTNPVVPPPPGYFATTTANYYTYTINWGGSALFVCNMSATTAATGQVSVRKL